MNFDRLIRMSKICAVKGLPRLSRLDNTIFKSWEEMARTMLDEAVVLHHF